jgi:hypothetical protein
MNDATVLQLRADLANLQADFRRAEGIVGGGLRNMGAAAETAKRVFAGLFAGVSGVALTRALADIVDVGDKLRDMSFATGASVEQLSFLDYAASQSGTSIEGLGTGVARLQRNLSDVAKGGGKAAAEALDGLGLSAQEVARLDLISQIETLGTALQGIQNPAERAAFAQQLFGRSAKDLMPLLLAGDRGLADLRDRFLELDGAIGTDQADTFDALNDSLGDIKIAARGAGAALADAFGPALTATFDTIANIVPFVSDTVARFFAETIPYSVAAAKKTLYEASAAIGEFFSGLPGAGKWSEQIESDLAKVRDAQATMDQIRQDSYEKEVDRRAALRDTLSSGSGVFGEITPGSDDAAVKKAETEAARRAQREADAIRQLQGRLVAERDATEAARVRFEIEEGAYREFSAAGQERLAQLAAEIDLQQQSAEVSEYLRDVEQQRREDAERATQAKNEERKRTIESLRTPEEEYADEVRRLLALDLDDDNLRRGIERARQAMEDAHEETDKTSEAVRELGLTFSSAFEDAVIEGRKFSEVLTGLGQDIARILLRKTVTEPLIEGVTDLLKTGGGGGTHKGGGVFGEWFGNLFGNARGGLYQVGGPSSEHTVAFTARAGEFVAVGAAGGGGTPQVVIHNYSPERVQSRPGASDRRQIEILVGDATAANVGAGRFGPLGIRPPLAGR